MKFNPLLLGIPVVLYALLQKKTTSTKSKDSKPKEIKPQEKPKQEGFASGFKLTLCDKLEILDQSKFDLYNETLLKSLIISDPTKISAIDFAKTYLKTFSKDCFAIYESDLIKTKEQFVLIYAILSKGIQYFVRSMLLENDPGISVKWKKYFVNLIAVENYIRQSQDEFDDWFENSKADGFSDEDYKILEKAFDLKDLPETLVGQGFEYNCASIKLLNEETAIEYFSQVAEFFATIEKFKDPTTIQYPDYVVSTFAYIAPNCWPLFKQGAMNTQELVIAYKLFEFLSDAYIANHFKSQDEITKYNAVFFTPQWNKIRETFFGKLSDDDIDDFDVMIEEKKAYP